jgi:hypothetical protein
MVPVLFELERHLEENIEDCDLVIPEQNVDPFHPIGNDVLLLNEICMKKTYI